MIEDSHQLCIRNETVTNTFTRSVVYKMHDILTHLPRGAYHNQHLAQSSMGQVLNFQLYFLFLMCTGQIESLIFFFFCPMLVYAWNQAQDPWLELPVL